MQFCFVLEYFSCEDENERQIPLALYIRLGYSLRACLLSRPCYANCFLFVNKMFLNVLKWTFLHFIAPEQVFCF